METSRSVMSLEIHTWARAFLFATRGWKNKSLSEITDHDRITNDI